MSRTAMWLVIAGCLAFAALVIGGALAATGQLPLPHTKAYNSGYDTGVELGHNSYDPPEGQHECQTVNENNLIGATSGYSGKDFLAGCHAGYRDAQR